MIVLNEQVLFRFISNKLNQMHMSFIMQDEGDVYSFLDLKNYSTDKSSIVSGRCFIVSNPLDINRILNSVETDILILIIKSAETFKKNKPRQLIYDNSTYYVVAYKSDEKEFIQDDLIIKPIKDELFSRVDGLFETGVLSKKKVAIIGLGSGGSPVALELVKSGVQHFVLIDEDRLEIGNVIRHVCGISDLGRYKTKAVKQMMLDKNPYADITTIESAVDWDTYDSVSQLLKDVDLVICATDNRQSKMTINRICIDNNKVCFYGGAFRRAYGGQVLRVIPHKTLCFQCFLDALPQQANDTEISSTRQADNVQYSDEIVPIEPGLSVDIAPISTLIAKLSILELLKDQEHTLKSLYKDFQADFYLWINRRECGTGYEQLQPLEYNVDGMHIMRWYGINIERFKYCPVCGEIHTDEIITPDDMSFFESTSENLYEY